MIIEHAMSVRQIRDRWHGIMVKVCEREVAPQFQRLNAIRQRQLWAMLKLL